MLDNVKILKIGGSVITNKKLDSSLNFDVVKNISEEIAKWLADNGENKLILTVGGGSFGHPLAHQYQINSPAKDKSPLGFVRTVTNVQKMANQIANIFQNNGVSLMSISPSSIFTTDKGKISASYLNAIIFALQNSLIPFLWGDAVFDTTHTYRVLSADQINTYLFENLELLEVVYGTNVDGIFSSDPSIDRSAELIEIVNNQNYDHVLSLLSRPKYLDVTKGMLGKLEEIHNISRRPLKSKIFNALKSGNVYKVLRGDKVGTMIDFSENATLL